MSIKNNTGLTIVTNILVIILFTNLCSCRKQGNAIISESQLIDSFIQQAQDSSYNNIKFSRDLLKKV